MRGHPGILEGAGQFEGIAEAPLRVVEPPMLEGDGAQQVHRPHAAITVGPRMEVRQRRLRQGDAPSQIAEPGRRGRGQQLHLRPARRRAAGALVRLQGFAITPRFHELTELAGGIVGGRAGGHAIVSLRGYPGTRSETQ